MTYAEQLKSPLWQKKRLEIFERDKFTCQICGDTETQLQVHHQSYDKTYQTKAWEYHNHVYKTLCADCHNELTEHIKIYGTDKEFDVMKINRNGIKTTFVYSKGLLKFDSSSDSIRGFSEATTHDIVQFLINNWLKNG